MITRVYCSFVRGWLGRVLEKEGRAYNRSEGMGDGLRIDRCRVCLWMQITDADCCLCTHQPVQHWIALLVLHSNASSICM